VLGQAHAVDGRVAVDREVVIVVIVVMPRANRGVAGNGFDGAVVAVRRGPALVAARRRAGRVGRGRLMLWLLSWLMLWLLLARRFVVVEARPVFIARAFVVAGPVIALKATGLRGAALPIL